MRKMKRSMKLTAMLLFLVTFSFAGCTTKNQVSANAEGSGLNQLLNKKWKLVSMGTAGSEDPIINNTSITVEFGADNRLHGSGGCNRYFGGYEVGAGNSLSIKDMGSTRMMCPEGIMTQEDRYFTALGSASVFKVEGHKLLIFYDNGSQVLNFISGLAASKVETFLVESSSPIAFAEFNQRLSQEASEGKVWVQDPIRIALEFMGSRHEPRVNIQREDQGGEVAHSTTVTVVEDGYLDDSVRGTWTRFKMKRNDNRTWRIVDVQRAYRCWRGHHEDSYSAQPCL
jgi:heat shock protein HslJ